MRNLSEIKQDTLDRCIEQFKNHKKMKYYKNKFIIFSCLFMSPLPIGYGIYKYNRFVSLGYSMEKYIFIMVLLFSMFIIITKVSGTKNFNSRIDKIANQYKQVDLNSISVLEDSYKCKIIKNGKEITSFDKSTKTIDEIEIDNVRLVIYEAKRGFPSLVIIPN